MLKPHYEQELSIWAFHFNARFPTWLDSRFTRGFYALLGTAHPSFLAKSPLPHLKRFLLIQFFLQKEIEAKLNQEDGDYLYVNVFGVDSRLCLSVAASHSQHTLTRHALLQVASQKVPALVHVPHSYYQWISPNFPYTFLYTEFDKMRGKDLSPAEVKEVKTYLTHHLSAYTKKPSIFWPYNHEETFKQVLTLGKEVTKEDDYPQVMIHFQKQTTDYLEFLISLARPEKTLTKKTLFTSDLFPPSTRFIFRLKHNLIAKFPILAEAFSLQLPIERFKTGTTTNLLHAREFIAKLLQDVLGTFRDYNGGLFEVQKKHYQSIEETFSKKIPGFSLFGRDLFYSLTPAEAPLCLDTPLWQELFKAFSEALSKKTSFSTKKTKHILILKSKDSETLTPYLEKAKHLQEKGKITAYANLKVESDHYLALIDEIGNDIAALKTNQIQSPKKKVLRLAFQAGFLPSLDLSYLAREMRGQTIGKLLFEGLFRLSPQNEIVFAGCKNVTLSKNKTRYLFELRPHYWSNGEQVTAFQYESGWKKHFLDGRDLDLFYIIKNADAIKKGTKTIHSLGIKALREDTLQVDLEREDPHFLRKLKHPIFFPRLESSSKTNSFNGPYFLINKENQTLTLEKNPYYWDKDNVFFKKITIFFERSCQKISKLFQDNKLDWIGNPCTYDVKISTPVGKRKMPYPLLIYFNTQIFPLSSSLIRQALSYALDRHFIAQNIFPGNSPLFTPLPDTLSSCTLPCISHNLEKAKKLFKQGVKALGLTEETFPVLEMSSCDQEGHQNLAKYLKKTWETTFGIRIKLSIDSWNIFYQRLDQGKFQVGGFFKCLLASDPLLFLESFSRKEGNFSHWTHKDYLKTIHLLKHTHSPTVRAQLMKKAETLLVTHMPFIPLLSLVYSYTHKRGLKDYILDQEGTIDFRYAFIQSVPNANRAVLADQSKALLNLKDKRDTELD